VSKGDLIEAHFSSTDFPASHFSHPEWAKCLPVEIARYWDGAAAPPGRHAEARLIWTNSALTLRFVCQQSEPLVVDSKPELGRKTMGLWDRDVCEVFIAPDPQEPARYFEFEAAPTGEWIDLAIQVTPGKRETDWEFHSGMTAAALVSNNQVTIGMRLPWDDWIHKPQRGEKWRVNLFRCVGSGPGRGYLAWQPTLKREPNFHVPEAFGWLRFS
jgi:hypothetical protein